MPGAYQRRPARSAAPDHGPTVVDHGGYPCDTRPGGTLDENGTEIVRVVGYVRETPHLGDRATAFAQGEHIRRWVKEHGHRLVAVCRDTRDTDQPGPDDGFRALLNLVRSGNTDAVVVATLEVLAADKILQEIILADLRGYGVPVISAEPAEMEELTDPPADATRLVVRDVLAKLEAYREEFDLPRNAPADDSETSDVIVELVTGREDHSAVSAAQAARPIA